MVIHSIGPSLLRFALAMGGVLGLSVSAHAVLGGAPMATPSGATATMTAPIAHPAVMITSSSAWAVAHYSVKMTTLSSGTVVREYIGRDGMVFGIAWDGPFIPDLATLLGRYFAQYTSAVEAQRAQHAGHGSVVVQQPPLVVHSAGHMGLFFGNAYLLDSLPVDLNASDIQ